MADTGPGMSGDVRRRACEPFFSTRPGCLGIGLSLAQAVARAHSGFLRIGKAGVPGGYTAVYLPVTSDAPDAPHAVGAAATRPLG